MSPLPAALILAGTLAAAGAQTSSPHWSFEEPTLPAIPPSAAGEANPIDAFVARRLSEKGLTRNPPAEPHTLARRIALDLTGLPPEPAAVDRFVKAFRDSPDAAVRQLVDRYLASPHYGERWAQHWLDVIRWAETVGFETNLERPNAWHYRDWVIAALNADMPYDRFLLEQIAGDTTAADAALGFLVAGPANLPGQIGRDEAAMRGARQDELDEVIRTFSQAVLGLTVGCARCHDHKFDPITQRDYYALQALFSGLSYGHRRLRGPQNDDWTAQVPEARAKLAALEEDLETLRHSLRLRPALEDVHPESFDPVEAIAVRMKINATGGGPASLYEFEAWTVGEEEKPSVNAALATNGARPSASSFALENQTRHFDNLVDGTVDKRQAFPWVSARGGPAWIRIDLPQPTTIERIVWHRGRTTPADYVIELLPPGVDDQDEGWIEVAHTRDRLPRVDDTRPVDQVSLQGCNDDQRKDLLSLTASIRQASAALARLSSGPQAYAARFAGQPGPTWFLERGDPMQRREEVAAAVPAVLGTLALAPGASEPERRLALVRHLTAPSHPLTARVLVNRVWHHHFGTGLVETPSDFGAMGAAPSHPDLLDWLAHTFVHEDGWSLKALHRRIMTSQTYRQASHPREEALAVDADSRLLWRYPPRRLAAEAIRDSILAVSGKLNRTMGGRGFDFFNQRGGLSDYRPRETFDEVGWRRMIYAHKVRMVSVDVFGAFDCPDGGQMQPRRTRSITPLQSLSLFNSPFIHRQAGFFADRLQREAGNDPGDQVDRAFALAFGRPPAPDERDRLTAVAARNGIAQVCRAIFNASEFLYLR